MEDNFQITSRSVRDVCHHCFSSHLWLTGSWELLQEETGMAYSGHCGNILMILTLLMYLAQSHSHAQMQDKTTRLDSASTRIDLPINNDKTKIMRIQHASNSAVTAAGQPLQQVSSFTCLGSMVDTAWDRCKCETKRELPSWFSRKFGAPER